MDSWDPGGGFSVNRWQFFLKLDPTPDSLLRSFWPSSFSIKDTKKSKQPKKQNQMNFYMKHLKPRDRDRNLKATPGVIFNCFPWQNKKTKKTSQNSSCH